MVLVVVLLIINMIVMLVVEVPRWRWVVVFLLTVIMTLVLTGDLNSVDDNGHAYD